MADPSRLLPVLQVPAWQQIPRLAHGFFTRRGGVSGGSCAELNLSFRVGDSSEAVKENWERVHAHVGQMELRTMNQVHGANVLEATRTVAPTPVRLSYDPIEADAMVTSASGVGLCVLTADCVPILLVSATAQVVAAVHAGWRGTVAGVVVAALESMLGKAGVHPGEIAAAVGPAIGPCCYEVDAVIADELESRWGAMPDAVRRYDRNGEAKARLDLRAVNTKLLADAGVETRKISSIGGCTSCESDGFFSYRAAAGTTGRQMSFIGWAL